MSGQGQGQPMTPEDAAWRETMHDSQGSGGVCPECIRGVTEEKSFTCICGNVHIFEEDDLFAGLGD